MNRQKLIEYIVRNTGISDVEIEHQKYLPNGGYSLTINGRKIGSRTTLKGLNVQAECFILGYKANETQDMV